MKLRQAPLGIFCPSAATNRWRRAASTSNTAASARPCPHSAGRRRSQQRTALGLFGFDENSPTPASRRRALPQRAPGSRRAPVLEPCWEPQAGARRPSRAPPATTAGDASRLPPRRFARPRRGGGGAHAQCARGSEWAPPCLPLPGSGERGLWRAAVLVASALPTG